MRKHINIYIDTSVEDATLLVQVHGPFDGDDRIRPTEIQVAVAEIARAFGGSVEIIVRRGSRGDMLAACLRDGIPSAAVRTA